MTTKQLEYASTGWRDVGRGVGDDEKNADVKRTRVVTDIRYRQ